jgi:uncharacterized spore protein YtfJ
MKLDEMVSSARDMIAVRRVYAEPVTQDGTIVITAAKVAGGVGGGGGHDGQGQEGEGGGFGVQARPAGAYVIKDGGVRWVPAVDVNRMMMMVATVLVSYLFTRARVIKLRTKARRGD